MGILEEVSTSSASKKSEYIYADGMKVDTKNGNYEFKDGKTNSIPLLLHETLLEFTSFDDLRKVIESIYISILESNGHDMIKGECLDTSHIGLSTFLDTITNMYLILMKEEATCLELLDSIIKKGFAYTQGIALLKEKKKSFHIVYPSLMNISIQTSTIKSKDELKKSIHEIVNRMPIIDVHTHLFPPSHGDLMLWGINELLTYHYLVAEYFLVCDKSISYEQFFMWKKGLERYISLSLFISHTLFYIK